MDQNANDVKITADAFEPAQKGDTQSAEHISGPSLSFMQNVWIRFRQNKAAMISAVIIIVMVVIAFGSSFWINNASLVKSAPQYANLPAKWKGFDWLNGVNGKIMINAEILFPEIVGKP